MALQLDLLNVNFFFFFFKNTQVCEGIAIVLKFTGLKVLYLSFKRVYDKNILIGIFH